MPHFLHQPQGDEGGGVAQVDHAGGTLGQQSVLSDAILAGMAHNVTVATNRDWSCSSWHVEADWALDQPPQLILHPLSQLLILLHGLLLFFHVLLFSSMFFFSSPM